MNNNNFFSNAYKYTELEERSQLENYLTESFVFILKYLIKSFPLDAIKILDLFGIEVTENQLVDPKTKNIQIETQKIFCAKDFVDKKIEKNEARPDIVIYQPFDQKTIIEVKVDASLNSYDLKKGKQIDQVDFYKNIKGVKEVYTLSKHFIDKDGFSNKVRWFQIYEILRKNESFVVKEFCKFLNEKNMGEIKKLNKESVFDFLCSVNELPSLIKEAWKNSEIKDTLETKLSWGDNEFGYYVDENPSRFVGLSKTENKTYKDAILYLDMYPSKEFMESFDKFNDEWFVLRDVIKIEKMFDLESGEAQLKMLTDWLKNKVAPML
ncbi:MAG: hypothetical protein J5588_02125 [Bacteroidales bacterium]|nr:hypothetical protein [Bacteroidales bacterium]